LNAKEKRLINFVKFKKKCCGNLAFVERNWGIGCLDPKKSEKDHRNATDPDDFLRKM